MNILNTPCGPIRGVPGRVPGTVAYKGIRYATAGRWELPREVKRWEGVFDGSGYGYCSYQPRAFYNEEENLKKIFYYHEFRKGEHYIYSEDCLFLNIYAPESAKEGDKLPVLFYIHGGGFTGGCGHEKHFDGPVWPAKGVIGVTINYRLGPMGFVTLPELEAEQGGFAGNYEWGPNNNSFSLYVTPPAGEPYTLWYEGNAFITPDDKKIGGEGMDVMARVEKWEKVIATLPNNKWEGTYSAEFVTDSVFRDSIKSIFVPPMSFKYDTIKVFDKLDTVSADTTCYYSIELKRDAQFANTGTFYKKSVRSTYDRVTKQVNIISETVTEYDCKWFFSEVSSDSKFTITLQNVNDEKQGEKMSISKYKTDEAGKALEFLLNGATFKHPELP